MFDKIRRRGFELDPSCELWMPVYRYGAEISKWWDYSGHNRHGTIVGPVPGYPAEPIIANGGFTTAGAGNGDVFASWVEWIEGGTSTIVRDATDYLSSPASCRFDIDSSNNRCQVSQGFTLLPNKKYRFRLFYKMSTTGKTAKWLLRSAGGAVVLDANGAWIPAGSWIDLPNITGGFAELSINFFGHPSYSSYQFYILSNSGTSSSFWFDDVSITLLDTLINPRWNFDGVDDRVVHSSINLGKLHTLHYWIERIGETSGMVHAGAVDYNGLRISDTTVGYSSGAGTAVAVLHNGAALTTKKTLMSVIRILDKVTFYQDGVQIGVEQTMGGQPDDLTLTDIGRFSDGTSYFKGIIHEATVFNDNKGFIGVRNYFEMTRAIQEV